jgi:hypothetical protein
MVSPSDLAKVVAVIDDDRVAINRGTENGVKLGQRYLVYELGKEVTDPDTGASLGKLEVVRGTGKVVHLQEKMATLKSDLTKQRRIRSPYPVFLSFGQGEELVTDEMPFNDAKVGDVAKPV